MRGSSIPAAAIAVVTLAFLGGSVSAAGPRLGIKGSVDHGRIIVDEVQPDGIGAALGLQEGDTVRWVSYRADNGWYVHSMAHLRWVLDRCQRRIVLVYVRDGTKHTASVRIKLKWVVADVGGGGGDNEPEPPDQIEPPPGPQVPDNEP